MGESEGVQTNGMHENPKNVQGEASRYYSGGAEGKYWNISNFPYRQFNNVFINGLLQERDNQAQSLLTNNMPKSILKKNVCLKILEFLLDHDGQLVFNKVVFQSSGCSNELLLLRNLIETDKVYRADIVGNTEKLQLAMKRSLLYCWEKQTSRMFFKTNKNSVET